MSIGRAPFGELVDIEVGFAFRSAEFGERPDDVRLLRGDNVAQGFIRWDRPARWAANVEVPHRYHLQTGDLVLAMDRPWIEAGLKYAQLRNEDTPAYLVQRVARLRAKPGVDQRYVACIVGGRAFTDYVQAVQTGTSIPHISGRQIAEFPIAPHPYSEQRAIAEVLGALDDKIAANTRLATTADALARLDFARALDLPGIEEIAVGQCATTVLGGTPSRDELSYWTGGTVGWLNSGKANEARILEPSEWITEEALSKSAAKVMPQRATVVAITGATLGQVARLEITASGNQSLIGIWSDEPAMNDWIYFAIQHEIPQLLRAATGAAQQHVNKRDLDALVLPILDGVELATWGDRVRPLLDLAAARERESLTLATTRDALLPALMSGKLRVRDAERVVEEVV